MPSIAVRIVSFVLGTTGIVRRRFSAGDNFLATIKVAQALRRSEPTAKMKQQFEVSSSDFGGHPVWTMAPKDRPASPQILFWHGGGYVYPIAPLHWKFLAHMVEKYGWAVTVPYYPLAPGSDAQATTDWALAFYQRAKRAGVRHGGRFSRGRAERCYCDAGARRPPAFAAEAYPDLPMAGP